LPIAVSNFLFFAMKRLNFSLGRCGIPQPTEVQAARAA